MGEEADTDNSGAVDVRELEAMLSKLGITVSEDELHALIDEADEDGDCQIDPQEWKQMVLSVMNLDETGYGRHESQQVAEDMRKLADKLLADMSPHAIDAAEIADRLDTLAQ